MTESTLIRIPCQPHDILNWEIQTQEARGALQLNKKIIWEFDLGLKTPFFPLEDELHFHSLSLALSAFTKEIWPQFQEHTAGVVLYRGSADFSSFFKWTERQEANWVSWKEGRADSKEAHLRRLFCAEAFSSYFQMLAHKLPDELPLTVVLDASYTGTLAEGVHLLFSDRFEYFVLEIENFPNFSKEAKLGICLPQDLFCGQAQLARMDELFVSLKQPFRIVFESFLSEQWEGLESLYVFSDALTVQGKRKLMGFCASGGTVITEGDSLNLLNEISSVDYFKEIGAEGFEPPAYWSQTSRASQAALYPDK